MTKHKSCGILLHMAEDTQKTTIYLRKELYERLTKWAEQHGISVSAAFRLGIITLMKTEFGAKQDIKE